MMTMAVRRSGGAEERVIFLRAQIGDMVCRAAENSNQ